MVFSEDIFGVIFIEYGFIQLFYRVPNKEVAARNMDDLRHLNVLNV